MRVAFVGQSGQIAIGHLRAVAEAHDVVAIAESRLKKSQKKTQLEKIADRLNARFFTFEKDQSALVTFLKEVQPDVLVVVVAPMLKPEVLAIPKAGAINFHPSLLPDYRGPNPYFWQYYHMEKVGGVTISFLEAGEDCGDIICQESFPIPPALPMVAFRKLTIAYGQVLMVRALDFIASGNCPRKSQKGLKGKFRARRITPAEEAKLLAIPRAERSRLFRNQSETPPSSASPPAAYRSAGS